jgi:hemoglobin-like flavoprotein
MVAGLGGERDHRAATGAAGLPGGDAQSAETATGQVGSADARLLRKSLALLEPQSERFMAHFFAALFVRNPELRPMFPLTLGECRKQVFGELTRCAWSLHQPESLAGWFGELGRDHRKFGVTEQHYRLFCDALLATAQAFCAGAWSGQARAAWERALAAVTAAMAGGGTGGTAGGAGRGPAWWLTGTRPSLTVIPVTSDEPGDGGLAGPVTEVALAHLTPGTGDIVVSGPPGMMARAAALVSAAMPAARLHADHLPGGPRPL